MTCVGEDVGCDAGETGAGLMEGGAAVVTDERLDMGGHRVVTASAGDSVAVSRVVTKGEE